MRGSDLSAAEIERATKPQKTWHFERMQDGMIFACQSREAWEVCYNKSTWKRRDFRLLGTSDGTTYNRIVKESIGNAKRLEPIIAGKKDELSKYMRAEEQLIMNEAVDMDGDPSDTANEENKKKVLRLRGIMDRLHKQLDELEKEYNNATSNVVKKANAAELEVAKKDQAARIARGEELDWPDPDANVITPDTNAKGRRKILGIMEGRRN